MSEGTIRVEIDAVDPNLIELREVARACRNGKLIGFPTETVYGIGGPMSQKGLQARLAEIKERDPQKPFSFHIGDWQMLDFLDIERNETFKFLSRTFWPGPLTLIVKDRQGRSVGIRYPRNRVTTSLINTVGEPFIGTSANKSGEASPKSAEDVMTQLGGQIDYLIDSGPCELGVDSTVVDLTGEIPQILRRGADADEIEAALKKSEVDNFQARHIIIVCTGNSCRSPMAEGWLRETIRRKRLNDKISVVSAGVMAASGRVATPEAVLVMKNREVDISAHKSQTLTREDVVNSDLIIAMSQEHLEFITNMVPDVKRDKIWVLEIPDPIGMGYLIYEQVMQSIEDRILEGWDKIVGPISNS